MFVELDNQYELSVQASAFVEFLVLMHMYGSHTLSSVQYVGVGLVYLLIAKVFQMALSTSAVCWVICLRYKWRPVQFLAINLLVVVREIACI
jgi:hypothetical protein